MTKTERIVKTAAICPKRDSPRAGMNFTVNIKDILIYGQYRMGILSVPNLFSVLKELQLLACQPGSSFINAKVLLSKKHF